ncbi:uncharacterized protein HMPREF1541_04508 [Cyphellophora europaea CBS 101466]|uniref:Ribonucleases P/MRP subunit Pop8-like domain-containing protein n=1 Tax=Cyphellophora europaea (strain CBS 101466) TaxID=1220924 RepID=W2RUW1_CYPE1|nr:uncharacterized protein HMPREF1541_04508 [Cyphellophora europaea CBS 101466]ETN40232.1 hypothetical protein HMPREF1541_04508 [Cyphellophora europaea CBS 101466]
MAKATTMPSLATPTTNTTNIGATTTTTTTTTTKTLRHPPYTYLHLRLTTLPSLSNNTSNSGHAPTTTTTPAQQPLDEITARQYLHAALSTALGLHGAAIGVDVLKVGVGVGAAGTAGQQQQHDEEGSSNNCWIRVPSEDADAVLAALVQWSGRGGVSWRIVGRGAWLGGLTGRRGRREVF